MTPDLINGLFETTGAALTAMNTRRVITDRGYAGVYIPTIVFFLSWGLWNLFYYPHLDQWFSFVGGILLVLSNVSWVVTMLYFGKRVA